VKRIRQALVYFKNLFSGAADRPLFHRMGVARGADASASKGNTPFLSSSRKKGLDFEGEAIGFHRRGSHSIHLRPQVSNLLLGSDARGR
jgi:hypothetical protein